MPRKKDAEPTDESLESDEAADKETPAEDEDLLPEVTPKAARSGGSGALWAIIVVFIVIVLAAFAYRHRERMQREADEQRAANRQVLGTQLSRVKDNVAEALKKADADPPDVPGAVAALNTAADQLEELPLSPGAKDANLSSQITSVQGQIRRASQTLNDRNTQYQEAVAAAERELKAAAQDAVKALPGQLDTLVTAAHGDVDTPLSAPGVSPATSGEEPTGEPTTTESQPAAPEAGAAEQPAASAEPKAETP
jgi:hypothetical protein